MKKFHHPFHLVSLSPWPLMLSFSIMIFMMGSLKFLQGNLNNLMIFGLMMILLVMFQWWRDVIREGVFLGSHTMRAVDGMKYGMMLFILSEIMFFISFFWSYFHSYLSPSVELGMNWSPKMIFPFDPIGVPLLNTMLLIISGIFLTWSHMCLYNGNKNLSIILLGFTVLLGLTFTMFQLKEYNESLFSINDSVFGSLFFMLTGFHGIHVLVGTIYLLINLYRMIDSEYIFSCHSGLEFSIWYWHFVDLVWLFLYLILYLMID